MFRASLLALMTGLFTVPAHAIDPCLVGAWQANGSDMARAMATQMGANVTHTGGRTRIEVNESGALKIHSEDMTYAVNAPGTPAFDVTVTGLAEGTLNADDGATFAANLPVFNMVGRATIFGEVMEIPVHTGTPGTVPGQASGRYECVGDTATFDSTAGPIPRQWQRVR